MKYLVLIPMLLACGSNQTDTSAALEMGIDADADVNSNMTAFLNEVCADASFTEDWVEFHNPGGQNVDISDAMIGDDSHNMFLISDLSADVIVPAGGYLVVYTKVEVNGVEFGFGLKKDGSENLYYTAANSDTIELLAVPEAEKGKSYALVPDGGKDWANGMPATPGASNAR